MSTYSMQQIWVVDDDKLITGPLGRQIYNLLEDEEMDTKFEVQTANNPVQAHEAIKASTAEIALVIADIMMPQMDGMKFLAHVMEASPMTPRIVLTGYADKENAIKGLNELDLFYYVEKPWKPDQLDKLILLALQKHRQNRIEAMFRRYVPYEIIEEYVDQSEESLLIGNEQEATIMFLDIAGFTPMAEKMEPKEVVNLLNNYLSAMVEIIEGFNGMVDKFTGDGLMALFGVPHSTGSAAQDARNGLLAAVEIAQKMVELNQQYKENPSLQIRIGLNTGKIVAGNIGSPKRVNYTAVSDAVNTASRIEDMARNYFEENKVASILVGESTYTAVNGSVNGAIKFETKDKTQLRGKDKAITLYKVTYT